MTIRLMLWKSFTSLKAACPYSLLDSKRLLVPLLTTTLGLPAKGNTCYTRTVQSQLISTISVFGRSRKRYI